MDILVGLLKIAVVFACLILGTRRFGMAASLGAGVLGFALLSGLPWESYVRVSLGVVAEPSFWYLELTMLCLLMFSEVFVRSGKCDDMVKSLEAYITSPRGRLVIFPFLLALLPVPGGAIMSCPMVESAGQNIRNLNGERMAVINYWFRHCLETVWPFYPGYLMVCVMSGISIAALPKYTAPIVLFMLLAGWIFLLRDIQINDEQRAETAPRSLRAVLFGGLPLCVTIATALASMTLGSLTGVRLFSDWAFVIAPVAGMATCLVQTGKGLGLAWSCAISPRVTQILLLMISIYSFKGFLNESDFVTPFVRVTQAYNLLPLVFAVVPFICGLAVGLYAGFVALCFPLLLPMLEVSPDLWEHRFAYITLAIIFGQMGDQLSPTHVCFLFSCEYFKANLAKTWQRLLPPVLLVMVLGYGWFWTLARV